MSGGRAPVHGIVFDKDGTLFDFATTWEAWASAFLLRLTDGDRTRAVEIGQAIGFDFDARRFDRDSVVIAGTPWEVAEALGPFLPDLETFEVVDLLNVEAAIAPQAEAVPLVRFLTELRGRGIRLGVATNDAEVPARAHLAEAGVTDFFDFIAGFDSGHGGKPAPGQLHAFCAAMDLAPDAVIMIGDSLHDLHAGRAAGMRTLGVLTGLADSAELAPHADAVLPDIGHLFDWLSQNA